MTHDHTPPQRFRDELRTSARLAAPLMAGHVSTGLIGLVDALIAGRHGTADDRQVPLAPLLKAAHQHGAFEQSGTGHGFGMFRPARN